MLNKYKTELNQKQNNLSCDYPFQYFPNYFNTRWFKRKNIKYYSIKY